MRNILIVSNTTYQIMLAINLAYTKYKNDCVDLIISDRITDYQVLSSNVNRTKIFCNIYALSLKKNFPQDNRIFFYKTKFVQFISPVKSLSNKIGLNTSYDELLFANLSYDISILYRYLKAHNNKIKVYMYEDGFATYSECYSNFMMRFEKTKGVIGRVKRIFHRIAEEVFTGISGLYVLMPELMTWKPAFDIITIDKIDAGNIELINIFNTAFDFNLTKDAYDKQVIFFEESYYADGYKANDVEIVEELAKVAGKENIFIKIHPRNPENRFKKLGYATNKNTSIPWEVIAMNIDLTSKTLVTIASVAAIVPCSLLGLKYQGILLFRCLEDDGFLRKDIVGLYEAICQRYPEQLHVPKTMDEYRFLTGSIKKGDIDGR